MTALPNLGGYTPSELLEMGILHVVLPLALTAQASHPNADGSSAPQHEPPAPASVGRAHRESLTLTVAPGADSPSTPLANRQSSILHGEALTLSKRENPKSEIVNRKSRAPRSKASQLPPDIQLNLNTMLAGGCAYRDIIRILNDQGYPGFNKVNLHNWKVTGYQIWLRFKTPEATT